MGSIEILVSAIGYFCIGIDLVFTFYHSIAYWYRLSVFTCIADTSIWILFLSTSGLCQLLIACLLTVSEPSIAFFISSRLERLFSFAGQFISPRGRNLSDKLFENLIFV